MCKLEIGLLMILTHVTLKFAFLDRFPHNTHSLKCAQKVQGEHSMALADPLGKSKGIVYITLNGEYIVGSSPGLAPGD